MSETILDDLLPDEPIPPELWIEPDQNKVIYTRLTIKAHVDELQALDVKVLDMGR